MSEDSLKQVAAAISARRTSLTPEEAKQLAVRAVQFKKERGRLPSISSTDAWEKRMAEGAAAFVRFKDEGRSEEHTSELQSLMRISYAVFCLKKKTMTIEDEL